MNYSSAKKALGQVLSSQGVYFEFGPSRSAIMETLSLIKPVSIQRDLVRVGDAGDGGYVLPNDFEGVTAILSPGVGPTASFEKFFADKGVQCFLLDGSVDAPPEEHAQFHFSQRFLATTSGGVQVSLDDWLLEIGPQPDLILQMDIEGDEWRIFKEVSAGTLGRFRVIAVELHDLGNLLTHKTSLKSVRRAFQKIRQTHSPVHVHPNNYGTTRSYRGIDLVDVLEVTFYREPVVLAHASTTGVAPYLDLPNNPHAPEIPIPESWKW